jgi:hypothetical protein
MSHFQGRFYGLDGVCAPRVHVLVAWSSIRWYLGGENFKIQGLMAGHYVIVDATFRRPLLWDHWVSFCERAVIQEGWLLPRFFNFMLLMWSLSSLWSNLPWGLPQSLSKSWHHVFKLRENQLPVFSLFTNVLSLRYFVIVTKYGLI